MSIIPDLVRLSLHYKDITNLGPKKIAVVILCLVVWVSAGGDSLNNGGGLGRGLLVRSGVGRRPQLPVLDSLDASHWCGPRYGSRGTIV